MNISDLLLTETDELLSRICEISTTATTLPIWQNRSFYLFVSLKNREFTKPFIAWFIELCEHHNQIGMICIVDQPYLFNRMAELAIDELPENERAKIKRLSWEVERKVRKVVNGSGSRQITILPWQKLAEQTPKWIKNEIHKAFENRGNFYQQVIRQVTIVKGDDYTQNQLDRYAKFFRCEIPVLVYSYYSGIQGIVDVYPGDNAELLWQLEAGLFEQELPQTTRFILAGQKLVYINVLKSSANPCPE